MRWITLHQRLTVSNLSCKANRRHRAGTGRCEETVDYLRENAGSLEVIQAAANVAKALKVAALTSVSP